MTVADASNIRLVISDVDGTLVTRDKTLTPRSVEAVRRLHEAGLRFSITSSRPPRGLKMLIDTLELREPIGAVNGGIFISPDLSVLQQHLLPENLVEPLSRLLTEHGLDVWLYTDFDWFVRDLDAPHVAREIHTVNFHPQVVGDLTSLPGALAKVVGVSDDHVAVAACAEAVRQACGAAVSATCSQPYYLDITHPDANKGQVVTTLSRMLEIPPAQIATIGDGANDVLMFAESGFSIAMGNASPEVQCHADCVTATNQEDGFALGIEQFILGRREAVYKQAS